METIDQLRAKRAEALRSGKALADEIRAAGRRPTPDESEKLSGFASTSDEIGVEIEARVKDEGLLGQFDSFADEQKAERYRNRPALYGNPDDPEAVREHEALVSEQSGWSPGELLVRGAAYAGFMKAYPQGGPAEGTGNRGPNVTSDAEVITTMSSVLGLSTPTARFALARLRARARGLWTPGGGGMRADGALITQADASAGELVRPDWMGLLEPGSAFLRPLTIRSLVTVMPISTDSYEYVKEKSRTSNAQVVADATALTGSSGLKPQGDVVFEKVSGTVSTIAEWVAMTRRIVKDAPQLMEYVNQFLIDDIALALEDEMVAGDGTGEHLSGLLNEITQEVGPINTPAGYNRLDLIRQAKRIVRIAGRTNATAVVINPEDSELVDIEKAHNFADTAGSYSYYGNGPFGPDTVTPIWGLPRVESEAVDPGTAIVGDFRRAILFDREETNLIVGTANDDLIRNLMRVVAEGRWGFGVIRPSAFVVVNF